MTTTLPRLILVWGLALVAGFAAAHAAEPPDHTFSVAVVIGNKAYQRRIPEVAYAHRDADAIRRYLVEALGYDEENIIDLRDASQSQMENALGNDRSHEGLLWRYLQPGESHVTVFYSGHGVPGLKDKRGYLLPVDADPDSPEISGYPVDTLYRNLAKLDARSVTVYLDACFSGESGGGWLIRSASPVFVQSQMPEATGDFTVLTAASAEQVASWDEEKQHGLFTRHLLDALYGKGDSDEDGRITVGEVKTYLDRNMTRAARRQFGRHQTATVQGGSDAVIGVVPAEPVEVAALMPAFEVSEVDLTMVVARPRVNTRAGPGTAFDKVASLDMGTEVEVTGKVDGKDWYRIALADGRTAYIFGSLLSEPGVTPPPPEPAKPPAGSVTTAAITPEKPQEVEGRVYPVDQNVPAALGAFPDLPFRRTIEVKMQSAHFSPVMSMEVIGSIGARAAGSDRFEIDFKLDRMSFGVDDQIQTMDDGGTITFDADRTGAITGMGRVVSGTVTRTASAEEIIEMKDWLRLMIPEIPAQGIGKGSVLIELTNHAIDKIIKGMAQSGATGRSYRTTGVVTGRRTEGGRQYLLLDVWSHFRSASGEIDESAGKVVGSAEYDPLLGIMTQYRTAGTLSLEYQGMALDLKIEDTQVVDTSSVGGPVAKR